MAFCSFGVAAGLVGLVMVAKIVRRIALHRRFSMWGPMSLAWAGGRGCGSMSSRGGEGGGPFGRHGGIGRSMWLRALFRRLDTTPGQEREIRSALEELALLVKDAGSQARRSTGNLAEAVRGEAFDDTAFEKTSARIDASVAQMKDAMRSALARIHAALDERQRGRFAAVLAYGFRGSYGRDLGPEKAGPYRSSDIEM